MLPMIIKTSPTRQHGAQMRLSVWCAVAKTAGNVEGSF